MQLPIGIGRGRSIGTLPEMLIGVFDQSDAASEIIHCRVPLTHQRQPAAIGCF
jgi:hypothetical protein